MSTATTFQHQDAFQQERMRFIGGSDVANLFDLEPYYCQRRLAYIKTGEIPDFPFTGNDATDRGSDFEAVAANRYKQVTQREIRKAFPKADKVVPILRPQPDYEIIKNERGPGMLSIKVPGYQMYVRLKAALEAWRTEPTTDWQKERAEAGKRALMPYILQVYAEIGAWERDWGGFGIFWADGMKVEYADVDADQSIIDDIRNRARAFWETKESKGVEGFSRLDPKSVQCGKCQFRVTCQQANLLKLLEGESKEVGVKDLPVLPILDNAVDKYREAKDLESDAKELVDQAKEDIRLILADCDAAEGLRSRAYNSLRSGRLTVQRDRLMKFARELSERAGDFIAKCEAKEMNATDFIRDIEPILREFAALEQTINAKFINKGAPYRELRVYDIKKKEQ